MKSNLGVIEVVIGELVKEGLRGGAFGRGTALQVGRLRVRFPMVPVEFFIDIILLAALWPWV